MKEGMNEIACLTALADLGRDLVAVGMVRGSGGNLSARLDGTIAITAAGARLDEITPATLVRLSLDGTCLSPDATPSSEWRLHLAAYRAWPTARVVIHAHPIHAIAWGTLGRPLTPWTPDAYLHLGPRIPLVPYIAPTTTALAEAVAETLRESPVLLLQNHGVVVVGDTVAEARLRLEPLEDTARIALLAHAVGEPRPLRAEEMRELDALTGGRYAFRRI